MDYNKIFEGAQSTLPANHDQDFPVPSGQKGIITDIILNNSGNNTAMIGLFEKFKDGSRTHRIWLYVNPKQNLVINFHNGLKYRDEETPGNPIVAINITNSAASDATTVAWFAGETV